MIGVRREGGKRPECGRGYEEECMPEANDVLSPLTLGPTRHPIIRAALRILCPLNPGPARGPPQPDGRDTQFHHLQRGGNK
jgi:hypothetical protein